MKKINIYNPRIPYFIMYRKGGWVFYNRDYKNLLTGSQKAQTTLRKSIISPLPYYLNSPKISTLQRPRRNTSAYIYTTTPIW